MSIFNAAAALASGDSGTWKTASCTISGGTSGTVSFNTTAKAKCFVVHWTSGNLYSSSYINSGIAIGAIYTGGNEGTIFKIRYNGSSYTAYTAIAEPVITDSSVTMGVNYPVGTWTAYYLV